MSEPNMIGMVTSNSNTADNQDTPAPAPARSDRSSSNEIFEIELGDHVVSDNADEGATATAPDNDIGNDDAAGMRPIPNMTEVVREEHYDADDDDDAEDDDVSSLNLDEDIVHAENVHEDESDDLESLEFESPLFFYKAEHEELIEANPSTHAMRVWNPRSDTYRPYYDSQIEEYLILRENGQTEVSWPEGGFQEAYYEGLLVIWIAAPEGGDEDENESEMQNENW